MTPEVRLLRGDQAAEAARQSAVSFGIAFDDDLIQRHHGWIAQGELWGVTDEDRVLAHCRITTVDHWFGGQRVPCQHVASVAVPPEHRGRGVASALMGATTMRGAEGLGLSLLFPATTRLYRKLGWEHAGTYTVYRLAAWDVDLPEPRPPAMRPAGGDADWAAIIACYDRAATQAIAMAARPPEVWEQLRKATYHYVHDGAEPGSLSAYALFDHLRAPGDWRYTIAIQDWAATSAAGLRALLGFIASHGSLGKDATFCGGWPEPWSLLVGEQHVRVDKAMRWMARGLDLQAAVAHRGFPPGLSAHVTIAVEDPLLPKASGPWRLEVNGGRGVLEPTGAAEVRLDARAVGPLFTGFRDPAQLALAGLVSGPPGALALLAAAFAGPPPTMVDFF